jgi:RNA polymerase sigma factor (sigma-70 family)
MLAKRRRIWEPTGLVVTSLPRTGARGDPFWEHLLRELTSRARIVSASSRGRFSPDDLAQETLTRLIQSYGEAELRARPDDQLMALAWRMLKNLAIDLTRKKSEVLDDARDDAAPRPEPVAPALGSAPSGGADEHLDAERRRARARAALDGLPENERRFLEHVLESGSVPLAQRECGWPPKSPYYVLRKLLDGLAGKLGDLR